MKADVICISHRTGASGYHIGEAAAAKLGYQLADDAIIMSAAKTEGLLPEAVSMAENPKAKRTLEVDFGRYEKTEAIRDLIRQAVATTADAGNVVIVSHAASYALAGRDNILRVLVTASDDTRAKRIADIDGVDEKQAAKRIAESDKARGEYLQAFYSVKAELPEHFDLVLSTDRLSVDEAAALIAAAAT